MKENWLNENLCSFDEKTRIELSPQLVKLECNDKNLSNEVTSPHYRLGKIDALGKIIAKGGTMTCVDWRCKHLPKVWKIYQWKAVPQSKSEVTRFNKLVDQKKSGKDLTADDVKFVNSLFRFSKVGEDESKSDALDFAKTLAGEM